MPNTSEIFQSGPKKELDANNIEHTNYQFRNMFVV